MATWLKQSTLVTIRLGPYLDKTDGVTEETLASPTVQVSKNHAAFVARSSATAITHDANGWFAVELDATDTNTLGPMLVKSHEAATFLPVWREFLVVPAMVYDSLVGGTDTLQADVTQWLGVAPNALVTGRVDTSTGAMAAGVLTAAAVATGAVDADALAADAVAEIADGVWDEDIVLAHGTADTAGRAVRTLDAISDRTNNANLNALLGVADAVGADVASQVTDEVWDEASADHVAVASLGERVERLDIITAGGAGGLTNARAVNLDNLDAAVTSRLAPTVAARTLDVTLTGTAGVDWANVEGQATVVGLSGTTVKAVTDDVGITQAGADKAWSSATRTLTAFSTALAVSVWDVLTANILVASSIGIKLKNWALGTDNRTLVSADAHTSGVTVAAVTGAVGSLTTNNDKTGYSLTNPAGIQKNVALNNFEFLMVNSADHASPKTGLTVTGTRSLDGAAFAALANAVAEVSNGIYRVNLAAADVNGDIVTLRFTASGADDRFITILTEP